MSFVPFEQWLLDRLNTHEQVLTLAQFGLWLHNEVELVEHYQGRASLSGFVDLVQLFSSWRQRLEWELVWLECAHGRAWV